MHRNQPYNVNYDCYLKMAMKREGVGVTKMSEDLGITRQTVYRYIRGEVIPNKETMVKIADYLWCDVDDIWIC